MNRGFGASPPVEEGETYDVEIEDMGKEGDGVAKVENFVVFIPDTEVGDKVTIEITKVLHTMAFGEVKGEADSVESEESEEEDVESDISVEEIELE
ncbi:MAG: TRAM domain-containing protein [Candidatus Saliniplasma sp.]